MTGDRGVQDEDGYFWFFARQDDLIISSGYRIGPFEVESALLQHHAVAESAAVASPDKDRGQVVKAFVVLADTHKDMMGIESKEKLLREALKKNCVFYDIGPKGGWVPVSNLCKRNYVLKQVTTHLL